MASLGLGCYDSDSSAEEGEEGEGDVPRREGRGTEQGEGTGGTGTQQTTSTSDQGVGVVPCDPAVQAKVAKFLELKRAKGRNLVEDIRSRKSFGNPDFLQKMVEHFGIDQYGSCYPRSIYNYEAVDEGDMYDKLEEQLVQLEERRRNERMRLQSEQQRQAIEFQRAGFVQQHRQGGARGRDETQGHPPQKKRRRPSGWQ